MPVRTVGVEEEFLLFDLDRPRLRDLGPAVTRSAERHDGDGQYEKELKQAQAEHASKPVSSLAELTDELIGQRRHLLDAAHRSGARLIASGTSPLTDDSPTTDDDRYQQMEQRFAAIQRSELTCAMHIHVSVESNVEAVAVLNRIGPWLPVLAALTANSPFHDGRDTGYSSFRRIVWDQWPTAGPTDHFADPGAYRDLVRRLVDTGAARDEGMIYFDARLSAEYPTVEIRVCDVCTDVEDAVTLAALSRALVETVAVDNRPTQIHVRAELLRAASWRAARFGMTDELADLTAAIGPRPLVPAWELADALVQHVRAALDDAGDTDRVRDGLHRIRDRGTGAQRQRRAAANGGPPAAIDAAAVRPQ
jgi:glutamate---cysteine ligase / carboxylate-amine ligase